MNIRDLRKVIGQFQLEHRTIQVLTLEDREGDIVWIRRIWPEPVFELGFVNELSTEAPKLHLFRAMWEPSVRELARQHAREVWHFHREGGS